MIAQWYHIALFLLGLYIFVVVVHFVIFESRNEMRRKSALEKERAKRRARVAEEQAAQEREDGAAKHDREKEE